MGKLILNDAQKAEFEAPTKNIEADIAADKPSEQKIEGVVSTFGLLPEVKLFDADLFRYIYSLNWLNFHWKP